MGVEWSMRYEIPNVDENLEDMHKSLKSEANMLGNTLMPFAQTLVNDSVNQMLGGDFAQGGRNSLRTLIDNQSQNGMYQTKVERVSAGAKEGKGSNSSTGGTTASDLEVTKVVYLEDATGKKLRTPLAISQYGIKIVPNSISIIETQTLGRLVKYIETKQKNITLQIEQDEKQKILVKQAQTSKLQGEKDLIDKTNSLNIAKQTAIISAERKVEEAKLQAEKETVERQKVADLAIIDKNRQLQEAKANEGIQRANAIAAKHEANAIKEVGFANAEVKKADYAAIDKGILMLEVDKAKALAMYESNMTVNMPTVVSGQGGSSNSLETMTTLKVMEQLGKSVPVSQ
jgi:ribosomal protein L25 (general stress protein Ctc)